MHLFILKGDSINACSKISFLCPNGTLQSMETTNPCTWLSRPWPAIITRKYVYIFDQFGVYTFILINKNNFKTVSSSTALSIQNMVNYLNTAKELKNASSWQWALNSLLLHYSEPISSNIIKNPKDYLLAAPGYIKAEEKGQMCNDRTYSMCIETIRALKKCQALSDISIIYGIKPKLKCVMTPDCGEKLKNGEVDIMILDADKIAFFRRYIFYIKKITIKLKLIHILIKLQELWYVKTNTLCNFPLSSFISKNECSYVIKKHCE